MPEHQDWPHFKYHPNLYELDILEHFEGISEFDYVWTTRKDDYVLVRDECGYAIVNRREQALLLIEDDKVDAAVVSRMLEAGCRIYEDILDAYSDV